MKVLSCVLILGFVALAAAEKIRFDNYKVVRVTPKSEEHVQLLKSLEKSGVSFWDGPNKPGHPSDLLLAPHEQKELVEGFQDLGMATEDFISNVQELMNKEEVRKPKAAGDLSWDAYYRLDDIYAWLKKQTEVHNTTAKLETYGKSYEGRDLNILVISKGLSHNRPIIFIEANIHAREWVTNAVATYVINELLNGNLKPWLDTFDFHIVPVTNPDGYEFTHTTNRMWRKTRSPTGSSLGCKGADPNRNWGYQWNTGGSSSEPCSDSYMGSSAFSESETKMLSEYYANATVSERVRFYFAIHSYSQYILIPYGFTTGALPDKHEFPEYDEYKEVSDRAVAALAQKYGTSYTAGGITELLYEASGGSIDWIYGEHKTDNLKLVLAAELRDKGNYGFLLPPNLIVPSAVEFIDALEVYLEEVK